MGTYGPSGAPIWTSPAIDEKRGLVFFGTGESNSPPVSKNTDAMIAVSLDDGKERWSLQGTDKDIYLSGCGPHPKPSQLNCTTDAVYRDVDFGASLVLDQRNAGMERVFGGQKSGTVWALDAPTGKLLWHNDLGSGSPLGGIHWGHRLVDGKLLWKYDTAIDYKDINGVPGKGGAIDAASISAADGFLFVNSGYNMCGQAPGNVFLAFRAKGH